MDHTMVDILWVTVSAALVFIMQAGFAMVESGLTRSKNNINVAIKNLTDLGVSIMGFWIVGFGLMFGASKLGIVGTGLFFYEAPGTWGAVFFLFQAMFCSTSATVVSGAVAERMRYSSYIIATIFLSLLIYPVFGHWVWGGALDGGVTGWLGKLGFIDFAGSTVVHSLGGWVALAILMIIGPRTGRFKKDGSVRDINGSNIPNVVLGVILLWFGWFGFNGGSTLAMNGAVPGIIARTTLAACAAMVGSLAFGWILTKKADVSFVTNGALAGLVAITAPAHAVTSLEAVLIGFVGGIVMLLAERLLLKLKIDDAVSAIPVHLAAGIWGTLAVGIFGDPEILGTGLTPLKQLGVQALGVVSCGVWAFSIAFLGLKILNKFTKLRVSVEDEKAGLNMAEHGVSTEINDLYVTMDEQTRTGDLSLRAPVEPFTEAGQIAGMYNKVIENLESNTIEKGAYLEILHNVSDGMFLLNPKGEIGIYYSLALESIFSKGKLGGVRFKDVLDTHVPQDTGEIINDFIDTCFNYSISWRNCQRLNPLTEVEFTIESKGVFVVKHLVFAFKRICKGSKVTSLLVMVRDETEQKELSMEIEETKKRNRSEMELLYKILHIEPETLALFMDSLETELSEINKSFQAAGTDYKKQLEITFRHSHAIKGDAELLALDFIAEKAEELEVAIGKLQKRENVTAEDFLSLTIFFSELQTTIDNMKELLGKWLNLNPSGKGSSIFVKGETENVTKKTGSGFSHAAAEMVNRLGKEYGKEINLMIDDDILDCFSERQQKKVKDVILQLLRNSIFHGIEDPQVRLDKGKDRGGTISVETEHLDGSILIRQTDDGNGIDKEKILVAGVKKGLIADPQQTLTGGELMKILFAPGVSTAEKPDRIAGKGVGMGLIQTLVKEMNGSIKINSRKGKFCTFLITLPAQKESA